MQTIKDHAPRVNTRLPYFDPANDPQAAGDATTRDLIWLERKRVMSTRNRNARRRTLGLPPTAA